MPQNFRYFNLLCPPCFFSSLVDPDVLQLAVQEGVEFEGDVELGKIATDVKPEERRPAWAQKVMACVEAKGRQHFPLFGLNSLGTLLFVFCDLR